MPQICAFLVRAEAWLEHGINDPAMALGMEDYESHIRMFAAGVRGVALPETLFNYRKRPGSMSKAFEPHGVAQLYRQVWRNSPALLHRYGPELVGLYAENGHGALAPSACEPSPHHAALFRRDIPDQGEVADRLEARASRDLLGRALRGRCWEGGAEWDYTVARILLALDLEPAFARQLLRAAVQRAPDNGWFRLYAMAAELRDGRRGAADVLWTEPFADFCREQSGPVEWITALEAVRGFPHVAMALRAQLRERADLDLSPSPNPLGDGEDTATGEFGAVHAALARLRNACRDDPAGVADADQAVRTAASELSMEAANALISRWKQTWLNAGLFHRRTTTPAPATFWGRTAEAYLRPPMIRPFGLSPAEAAERERWMSLAPPVPAFPKPQAVVALGRRLRRRPSLDAAE